MKSAALRGIPLRSGRGNRGKTWLQ